jgi:hypothetical protein
MSLAIALDELRSTGWSGLDSTGCAFDSGGRAYPTVDRVRKEFAQVGLQFDIAQVVAFNCFCAKWSEAGSGVELGSVVSLSEQEAAVYALAQMRRARSTVDV